METEPGGKDEYTRTSTNQLNRDFNKAMDKNMSGTADYIRALLQPPRKQSTICVDKVPLMFVEPHILQGYRPTNKSWTYYLVSFFHLHNESVNVWTHSVAIIIVLCQMYRMSLSIDFYTNKDAEAVLGFGIGILINYLLSSSAHLLHSKSPWWHYVLFMGDYAGVTFCTFASCIASLYIYSHPSAYAYFENFYLPLNVFMSWIGFLCCCVAKLCIKNPQSKKRKFLMVAGIAAHAILAALPSLYRFAACLVEEDCRYSSLLPHSFVLCFVILNGVTFSMDVPERWFPGRCDVFGHGHQIFHVCCVITSVLELYTMQCDIMSGASAHTVPNFRSFLKSYVALFLLEFFTLVAMIPLVNKKVKEVLNAKKQE